jgi:hypothetical protein
VEKTLVPLEELTQSWSQEADHASEIREEALDTYTLRMDQDIYFSSSLKAHFFDIETDY